MYKPEKADWSNGMRGLLMVQTKAIRNWCIIYVQNDQQLVDGMLRHLFSVCPPMGMTEINKNPDRYVHACVAR